MLIQCLAVVKTKAVTTTQSIESMQWRITNFIRPELRHKILMGHCSGAEVWGFTTDGSIRTSPFYSLYENALTDEQKQVWRRIVAQVTEEFKLQIFPAGPLAEFKAKAGNNPLAIMLEDRGPQITLEVINGYDLTPEQEAALEVSVPNTHGNLDLRVPILERLDILLQEAALPISPRLAGVFAIDLALKGVSKTTAIKTILNNTEALGAVGLSVSDLKPEHMEVWGGAGTRNPRVRALPDPKRFRSGRRTDTPGA
jgi:hypothetical protein